MPASTTALPLGEGRKRKTHKKSRRGCKNCKLRGVKCDEAKSNCKRCTDYRVACNYDTKTPDLHMVFDGPISFQTSMIHVDRCPKAAVTQAASKLRIAPFMYPAVYSKDGDTSWKLSTEDLDRLGRFQTKTILSFGTTRSANPWQHIIVEMACSNPYLMHVIQTLTAIHDRYTSSTPSSPNSRLTLKERHHLSSAASLFREKLSKPIRPQDRDGIWAAAAMLGCISFASIEASIPEESWPLTPPDPSDLEWIKMSEKKAAVWEIAKPYRPDSVFYALVDEYEKSFFNTTYPEVGIDGAPAVFVKLCDLNDFSTSENNPYFCAVHHLSQLLKLSCERSSMGRFLSFIAHMKPTFKLLLEERDPRALVILAYWHMKVADAVWFLDRRTKMECRAICIYLERYHWLDKDIMKMIQAPKKWSGLIGTAGTSGYGIFPWGTISIDATATPLRGI